MKTISGTAASRGITSGPAFQYRKEALVIRRQTVDHPEREIARLEEAILRSREDLQSAYQHTLEQVGPDEAAIFEAHGMILEDPELLGAVKAVIHEQKINAEAALKDQSEIYAEKLEALDNEYFQERAADVRDVIDRTLRNLLDRPSGGGEPLLKRSVILADDLTPSDTIQLDTSLVLGFCTAKGGSTSHTAILARALGIPAVVGAGENILTIPEGDHVILDGTHGQIILDADRRTREEYRDRQLRFERVYQEAIQEAAEPAVTVDGRRLEIAANIGSPAELASALENGAEGVGLLRTEFVYLGQSALPDEEQQTDVYRKILEGFGQKPVILRTLDIGGDKELPYLQLPEEMNPFLGVRAIRLSFQRPSIFKAQLRAALRAGASGCLKIMFPMIASRQEIQQAKAVLEQCQEELRSEGTPFAEQVSVGVMIEIPSAAILADQLVEEVEFFSIGTNDLSQYTYAADRINAEVSHLASGFQPGVLRLIASVVKTAHRSGKWVGCCGELAGDPLAIPILVGLGVDELSMNPPAIPFAKQLIRTLNYQQLRTTSRAALEKSDHTEVREWVRKQIPEVQPFLEDKVRTNQPGSTP